LFQFNSLKRVLVLTGLTIGLLHGQENSQADFKISVDYSRFSIEGGVYLDVYLLIPQSVFTYMPAEEGLEATVIFQASLVQDEMLPYPPDRWQRIYKAPDRSAIASMSWVPDITKFFVEPGDYLLQIDIVDVNSNQRQRIRKPLSLIPFPSDELNLSDITIASQIIKTSAEHEFTKYGYDVVPNAQRTFTSAAPMLYYFLEAYGLSGTGTYSVLTQIQSLNEDIVQKYPSRSKKMPGKSVVEWGGVNTAGLTSGIYKLAITISDDSNGKSITQKRTFYILRPAASNNTDDSTKSEYAGLDEAQLDDIFKVVNLIMDKNEKRLFTRSDVDGKRNILTAFWDRKDPNPETVMNEFKQEFYQRVQAANSEYGSETDPGWSSDRGRILIKYGKPNNIERQNSSIGQRPWESWQYYEMEGGVTFIFVDRTGYGSYQLVHSDARDEVRDPDWERFLD